MDNLKSPAYPWTDTGGDRLEFFEGFTKLEKAALMIAQGYAANSLGSDQGIQPPAALAYPELAKMAVSLAKAVLEEANK